MKRVNILWPKHVEDEYLRLCEEFYETLTDDEAEKDDVFFAKRNVFIDSHASDELKKWMTYTETAKRESA